jgi:rubredoxin
VPDDLVTLWRYRDLPEALIAQNKLHAEGFDCFLADDEMIRLNWFWSNLLGGVRLCLREDEADAALAVLAEEIPTAFNADEVNEEYQQPVCPKCESRDLDFETVHKGIALGALWLFALPVPVPANHWKCENCGHVWKGEYV